MANLATLERRQVERLAHLAELQALIERRQLEIENLRAARIERKETLYLRAL